MWKVFLKSFRWWNGMLEMHYESLGWDRTKTTNYFRCWRTLFVVKSGMAPLIYKCTVNIVWILEEYNGNYIGWNDLGVDNILYFLHIILKPLLCTIKIKHVLFVSYIPCLKYLAKPLSCVLVVRLREKIQSPFIYVMAGKCPLWRLLEQDTVFLLYRKAWHWFL